MLRGTDATKDQLWLAVLTSAADRVSEPTYAGFLRTAVPLRLEDHTLTVGVSSQFARAWIAEHHGAALERCLQQLTGEPFALAFEVSAEASPWLAPPPAAPPQPVPAPQGPSPTSHAFPGHPLNPRYTFDHFVVAPCNQFAHAAALQVARAPGTAYNVLFIHSKVGLGKTHLMQAIGHHVRQQRPELSVVYISAEGWVNHVVTAIRDNRSAEFRDVYRSVDVWLVDDIQFMAGVNRPVSEEEFFHTFNALCENGKQVVVASDAPPRALPLISERLRSRLEAGIIADLRAPDFDTRLAILEKKAQTQGLPLSHETLVRVAKQLESNVRALEGALNQIGAHLSLNPDAQLTPALVDEIIRNYSTGETEDRVTIEEIAEYVADQYRLTLEDLTSPRRTEPINECRQVAIYLARELTDHSLQAIGEFFGGRDHSTVLHAYRKISELVADNPQMLRRINAMKTELQHS